MTEPLRVNLVQLMALFGETFNEHGRATDEQGRTQDLVYFPEYRQPNWRQTGRPMAESDFTEEVHEHIRHALGANPEGVYGMVVFEVKDLSSSHMGERAAMCFGPSCTYKTLDEAWWYDKEKGQLAHLGDQPSVFKYPTCYFQKEEVDDPDGRPNTTVGTAMGP